MTEPTPMLHLPREHVMALTQILNQLSSTLAESRRRREQQDEAVAAGLAASWRERNMPLDVPALAAVTSAREARSAAGGTADGVGGVPSLASRLPMLPAAVADDPDWVAVERRFQEQVRAGADPERLADAVGQLDYAAARFPTSLARWELDRASVRAEDGGGRDAERAAAFSQLTDAEADARREREEAEVARSEQLSSGDGTRLQPGDELDSAPEDTAVPDEGVKAGEQPHWSERGGAEAEQDTAREQVAEHDGRAADADWQGETFRDGALARSLTPTPEARAAWQCQTTNSALARPQASKNVAQIPRPRRRRFGR